MSYNETLQYLYNLQKYGIKFGLENISRLMSALDNPHEAFRSVHVAGTNGKGSTSAIIASILQAAGFRVGLFTSPHLVSFTERIRINNEEINETDVITLAEEIRDIVSRLDDFLPTFFEVVTAIALLHFKKTKIDVAVIEVGMGGKLDATNIIMPGVSVITNISYDHKEFLGSSLKEIAYEKAGIIKKKTPAVVSYQEPEIIDVLRKKAREQNAELFFYGRDFSSVLKKEDVSGICFDYNAGDSFTIRDLVLPLPGEHQMQNASVAIKAVELIDQRGLIPSRTLSGFGTAAAHHSSPITHHIIRTGLENVSWPGRLEFIHNDPPIVIDGAHNPDAAAVLSRTLKKDFLKKFRKIIIILGIMDDKDIKGIMEPLLPLASEIILTSPAYTRAATPEKLADIASSLGFPNVQTSPTVKGAIEMAIRIAGAEGLSLTPYSLSLILVTGSFYTIGEAKEALGQKGILSRLRE